MTESATSSRKAYGSSDNWPPVISKQDSNFKKSFTSDKTKIDDKPKTPDSDSSDSDWGELDGAKDSALTDQGTEIKKLLDRNRQENALKVPSKSKKAISKTTCK